VVAPSSPFDHTLVRCGIAWLGTRYRVRFDPGLFGRDGFLAGSDERRLAELNQALADGETHAIVAARGGYGLGRIAPDLRLDALVERPKWIVGFSDLTALHLEAVRAGVMSLHAHNVAGLGRGDAAARHAWSSALEGPQPHRFFKGSRSTTRVKAQECSSGATSRYCSPRMLQAGSDSPRGRSCCSKM